MPSSRWQRWKGRAPSVAESAGSERGVSGPRATREEVPDNWGLGPCPPQRRLPGKEDRKSAPKATTLIKYHWF